MAWLSFLGAVSIGIVVGNGCTFYSTTLNQCITSGWEFSARVVAWWVSGIVTLVMFYSFAKVSEGVAAICEVQNVPGTGT